MTIDRRLRVLDGGLADPPSVDGRMPPHNLDVEGAVLGALLVDPAAMQACAALLSEHFYSERHRRIFEACRALETDKEPVDIVQVGAWLKDRGRLSQVGGLAYLTELLLAPADVRNVGAYANNVIQHWRVRSVILACQRGAALGYGDVGQVDEYISGIITELTGVLRVGKRDVETNLDAVKRIVRIWNDNANRIDRGEKPVGLPTGIRCVDEWMGGLHGKRVYTIGARPGGGKSAFGLQVAGHVASTGELTAVFFSMEMPRDQQMSRLICVNAAVDSLRVRKGEISPTEWERMIAAASAVAKLDLVVDETRHTIHTLRAKALQLISECSKTKPVGLFVLDYIQLLEPTQDQARRKLGVRDLVTENAKAVKALANETGLPWISLAQVSRAVEQTGRSGKAGTVRRPIMSDLGESSGIEANTDDILFIHPKATVDEDGNEVFDDSASCEIVIRKARDGKTGIVPITFEKKFTRFKDPDDR